MCHRTDGLGAPLTALCAGTIKVFFNVRGYVGFSSPVFWQPAHQCNELFGGGSRLRLRQRRSQFRHDFVAHHDLDFGAGIFPYLAHQFREPFACFTDRQFHGVKCTRAYKMNQQDFLPVCQPPLAPQTRTDYRENQRLPNAVPFRDVPVNIP